MEFKTGVKRLHDGTVSGGYCDEELETATLNDIKQWMNGTRLCGSYTNEEIKAMDYDTLMTHVVNEMYDFTSFYERLEHLGVLFGNGHHMAQHMAEHAENMLVDHWKHRKKCDKCEHGVQTVDIEGKEPWERPCPFCHKSEGWVPCGEAEAEKRTW